MDKETDRRRSWLWKKKNGFEDGGTSPTPVKLFDEQAMPLQSLVFVAIFISLQDFYISRHH